MDNADDLLSGQVRVAWVGSNHDVEIMFESVMRLCVSTYTGWDHKWDLLVIESVHVICVD